MITGEDFANELLKKHNITPSECLVVTKSLPKASTTIYKKKGISTIILQNDSSATDKIVTAAHEVGHFLNNKNNPVHYTLFFFSGRVFTFICILYYSLIILNKINITPGCLTWVLSSLSILSAIFAIYIKSKDERCANSEAWINMELYTDQIFQQLNDPRNFNTIKIVVEDHLNNGTKTYYKANLFIFPFLVLIPLLLHIFLIVFI